MGSGIGGKPGSCGSGAGRRMSDFGQIFSAFRRGLFFGGDGVGGAVPQANRDGPIEGERHHQDQTGEALGVTDLAIFQTEAPGFKVREHDLDTPTQAVIRGRIPKALRIDPSNLRGRAVGPWGG